ncbi:DUF441 domain-containing protein [Gilliamella sp. B2776]|uniref:DUF441 domain-containing protein n=1 Tax=unclassified Gilliamella TaxID=2685620 RepID=UPI002269EC8D|nr:MULTISPECIES: DUF441 domain-containing protein [unclassified Gilliamella]MCX8650799.1 DUF441 domain-containing protein [Gilliamella sp. B2779]MCX8654222.1 DUF441 domain-containing protein [Gilliamella sp. B2737]MCX8664882.1 DUF441 domain-containing protein [Gilliamella sp. B2887]MCX8692657.1 DUF441 domain-containing protein [Gilliamella sp. B2776]MCX8697478.1 DUF441 domain-containing protein [Gilliamella sp. B3000]
MFAQFDISFFLLLGLAALCYLTHNNTVTFAILLLLMFKLTPLAVYFPFLNKYGLTIGVVILTAAMMVPLADGSLKVADIVKSFTTWQSIVAIAVGILVSWLGTRGISLIGAHPTIVNGLIIGTLIGVAFFKGIPVGPLIAAGILSLLIGKN